MGDRTRRESNSDRSGCHPNDSARHGLVGPTPPLASRLAVHSGQSKHRLDRTDMKFIRVERWANHSLRNMPARTLPGLREKWRRHKQSGTPENAARIMGQKQSRTLKHMFKRLPPAIRSNRWRNTWRTTPHKRYAATNSPPIRLVFGKCGGHLACTPGALRPGRRVEHTITRRAR